MYIGHWRFVPDTDGHILTYPIMHWGSTLLPGLFSVFISAQSVLLRDPYQSELWERRLYSNNFCVNHSTIGHITSKQRESILKARSHLWPIETCLNMFISWSHDLPSHCVWPKSGGILRRESLLACFLTKTETYSKQIQNALPMHCKCTVLLYILLQWNNTLHQTSIA